MVRSVDRVAPCCEQFNGLADPSGLIDGALLAD
jgi:hypothetical protein